MYTPVAFAETDSRQLHDFIEQNSFGLLVSRLDQKPVATHLPFLLHRGTGTHGTLTGHMARANPQWREAEGEDVLAVFSGPHAYISPAWYEAENVVPTWNYAAVHATGPLELIDDPEELRDLLRDSVGRYEGPRPEPWKWNDSAPSVDRLLSHIVGFRITIERLEGKWKLSQNQSPERQDRVIRGLEEEGTPDGRQIAGLMRKRRGSAGEA